MLVAPFVSNIKDSLPVRMSGLEDYTKEELLEHWNKESDMKIRDNLILELKRRKLFPSEETNAWESESGLYPETNDPNFTEKLMHKQEFLENIQ